MLSNSRLESACRMPNGKQNVDLRDMLSRIIDQINVFSSSMGVDVVAAQQAKHSQRTQVPQLASMTVTGDDGHFSVQIFSPFDVNGEVYHEIQSSATPTFTTSLTLETYGPSPATARIINLPASTRYWRWRSKYADSPFNAWQNYPTAVYSGTIRSITTASLNVRQLVGESPIVQVDTSRTLTILPFTMRLGEVEVNYDGGSLIVDDYDTYYIYFADPNKVGGVVNFQASTSPFDAQSDDGNVILGVIAVTAQGGGLGMDALRPFQSSCVIGASVVTLYGGATKLASAVGVGDVLLGVDGGAETVVRVEILESRPCFGLTTQSGLTLQGGCAHHLIYCGAGGCQPLSMIQPGDQILIRSDTENQVDYVLTKPLVPGLQTVYRFITDRTRTYLVDNVWSRDFGAGVYV